MTFISEFSEGATELREGLFRLGGRVGVKPLATGSIVYSSRFQPRNSLILPIVLVEDEFNGFMQVMRQISNFFGLVFGLVVEFCWLLVNLSECRGRRTKVELGFKFKEEKMKSHKQFRKGFNSFAVAGKSVKGS